MSDRVVSFLRTAVPSLWGTLLGLLLPHLPWLPASVAEWLASAVVVQFVVGLCIVAWYAVWRWAEPRIPAWLVTLVLGSSKSPVYGGKAVGTVRLSITPVTHTSADSLADEIARRWMAQNTLRASGTTGSASTVEFDGDRYSRPAAGRATAESEADAQTAGNDRDDFPYA